MAAAVVPPDIANIDGATELMSSAAVAFAPLALVTVISAGPFAVAAGVKKLTWPGATKIRSRSAPPECSRGGWSGPRNVVRARGGRKVRCW